MTNLGGGTMTHIHSYKHTNIPEIKIFESESRCERRTRSGPAATSNPTEQGRQHIKHNTQNGYPRALLGNNLFCTGIADQPTYVNTNSKKNQ